MGKSVYLTLVLALVVTAACRGQSMEPATSSTIKVTSTTASLMSSFFIDDQQGLWAFGNNSYGQLATGNTVKQYLPVKVMDQAECLLSGEKYSLVLKTDGTLWACGNNDNLARFEHVADRVTHISTGSYHTLIVKDDGTVWSTGSNGSGQLGTGQGLSDRNRFEQVIYHTK